MNFDIEDIYKACHQIILKDKRDFKNMTRYELRKIMNIKKRTRLLHERLIEAYMVSNNNNKNNNNNDNKNCLSSYI